MAFSNSTFGLRSTGFFQKNMEPIIEAPVYDSSAPLSVVETPNTILGNKSIPFVRLGVIGAVAFGVIYCALRR